MVCFMIVFFTVIRHKKQSIQYKKKSNHFGLLFLIYFFLQQDGSVLADAKDIVDLAFASFTNGQSGVPFNLHSFTMGQSAVPFNGQSFTLSFPANAKRVPPASIIVPVAIPKNLFFIIFNS